MDFAPNAETQIHAAHSAHDARIIITSTVAQSGDGLVYSSGFSGFSGFST